MGTINGNTETTQADWDTLTAFLRQITFADDYARIVEDGNIVSKEIFTYIDPHKDGRLNEVDAERGMFNCSFFQDVAGILRKYKLTLIHPINPQNIACEKLACAEEEQKLSQSQAKENGKVSVLINGIKDPICRDRIAFLAAGRYLAEGDMDAASTVMQAMDNTPLKQRLLVKIKIEQASQKLEALKRIPPAETTDHIAQQADVLKKLIHDLKICVL